MSGGAPRAKALPRRLLALMIGATVLLAVTVFSAFRLYQIRPLDVDSMLEDTETMGKRGNPGWHAGIELTDHINITDEGETQDTEVGGTRRILAT